MNVKDQFKLEDLLTNVQVLEGVFHALYPHAETEEQHVLYTVCLFTYVGKLCKDLSVGSHELIADKVIYVLKSTEKGLFRHVFVSENVRPGEDQNDSQESGVTGGSNSGSIMVCEKAVNIVQNIGFLSLMFLSCHLLNIKCGPCGRFG